MNVKDELLSILLESGGGVSGSELSERIGCSRMAISKSAAGLSDEGYRIEVSRSGGYRLEKSDVLSLPMLQHSFGIPVYYRPVCGSTMTEAKDLVNKGAEAPFAVVAGRQEGGRGRLGRSFFSPEGGVYMSVVISGVSIPKPDMLTTGRAGQGRRGNRGQSPARGRTCSGGTEGKADLSLSFRRFSRDQSRACRKNREGASCDSR